MNLLARLKLFGSSSKVNVTPAGEKVAGGEQVEEQQTRRESYRIVTEDKLPSNEKLGAQSISESNMVTEQNPVADGADEQMLGADEKLTERRDEVKFIKGDQQNGDAKIDINLNGKQSFTGMTKEELMKYANDPFWVRLRWIFFVGFWLIWVAMLVGAILIIVGAPKCAAPQPLPWYKRGLHAKFESIHDASAADVETAKKLQASGVIYELPGTETYSVKQPEVENKIKSVVEHYKGTDMRVVLDLTPNYMSKNSQLLKSALDDPEKRNAFVWSSDAPTPPTKWLKVGGNQSAWESLNGSYVLSQFGEGYYDLRMNHTLVRQEFGDVLRHLLELGVQGFRLNNTKFFVIEPTLEDEEPDHNPKDKNLGVGDYFFYNHAQTTFQKGLGDVLYDYASIIKNISADAFLGVTEDVVRPEAYERTDASGSLGIELPIYGQFVRTLSSFKEKKNLQEQLQQTLEQAGNNSWLQWNFKDVYVDTPVDPSAVSFFMALLPGVPVIPIDSIEYKNVTAATYTKISTLRRSPSYMHGELKFYNADPLLAYSRTKSGNPGYFVAFNPTAQLQSLKLVDAVDLPDKMTVAFMSENFGSLNGTALQMNAKTNPASLQLEPYTTIILSYVPVKAE